MYDNPAAVMDNVTDFLGLCRYEWGSIVKKVHNRKPERYQR